MPADQVQEILVALGKIETKVDAVLETVGDHETRLRTIEAKGGKRWDSLVGQVISIVVAAVIGGFIGHFVR